MLGHFYLPITAMELLTMERGIITLEMIIIAIFHWNGGVIFDLKIKRDITLY